jgi:hypothetical protein
MKITIPKLMMEISLTLTSIVMAIIILLARDKDPKLDSQWARELHKLSPQISLLHL